MNSLQIIIKTCPVNKYYRYSLFYNLNDINLKNVKEENKSIIFLNDDIDHLKYKDLLKLNGFELFNSIEKTNFNFTNSPLFISKYKPNLFNLYIYK